MSQERGGNKFIPICPRRCLKPHHRILETPSNSEGLGGMPSLMAQERVHARTSLADGNCLDLGFRKPLDTPERSSCLDACATPALLRRQRAPRQGPLDHVHTNRAVADRGVALRDRDLAAMRNGRGARGATLPAGRAAHWPQRSPRARLHPGLASSRLRSMPWKSAPRRVGCRVASAVYSYRTWTSTENIVKQGLNLDPRFQPRENFRRFRTGCDRQHACSAGRAPRSGPLSRPNTRLSEREKDSTLARINCSGTGQPQLPAAGSIPEPQLHNAEFDGKW